MNPTETNKTETKLLPKHVRVGGPKGTCLVRSGRNEYYRHAGVWSVRAEWDGDRVIGSKKQNRNLRHLAGVEFVPCTKEEHDEDNDGYLPGQPRNPFA